MKSLKLLLALNLVIGMINLGQAQTVDEIIEKHIKARGGIEAWEKVESIKYSGTFTGFSIPKPFTTVQKRPNLYRSDYGLSKFNVVLAHDGSESWTIDPWFDVSFARLLNDSEQQVIEQKAEFTSPFFDYKSKGYEITFKGKVTIDGVEVFHLELIKPERTKESWYLDASTYLEFKQESLWDDFGFPINQETYFDDFRKIEEITIPFYIERAYGIRNRMTEVENLEINPSIPTGYFSFPISKNMQTLEFMQGEWSVIIEAPGRRGLAMVDSVACEVIAHKNKLKISISYDNYFRFNRDITLSYHDAKQGYQLTSYNHFDSQMEMYVGNWKNDSLNFKTITLKESNTVPIQLIKLNKDQFLLEFNSSEGQLQERFNFKKGNNN